ncbi:MAG: hypothetical protein IKT46_03110 [Clostridia bacterium]|nr:hypothetical protein [Clostridia bacterium]
MKKIISMILAVLILTALLCACSTDTGDGFDYKSGYEKLSQTLIEQEYVIEELKNSSANRFPEGTVCVCFGDSVLGKPKDPADYASVIAEKTGLETVNAGIGGASIAQNPNQAYDAFSLYRLVDAIVSQDWTLQDQNIASIEFASAATRYEALKAVDWSKVSIVTIGMGLNDIQNGYAIDNAENARDTATVKGALRYSIEKLVKAYPNLEIMVLTPTYRYMINADKGCNELTYNGNTYTQYIDAVISVAKEYNLPYVDLYRNMGVSSINYKCFYLEGEGTHFNNKGNEKIGKMVANQLLLYFK